MLRLQRRDERGVVCTQCGAGYGNAEAWVHPECQPFWFRSHPLPEKYSANDDANSQKDRQPLRRRLG
jgi:hypothetical protein